MVSLNVGSLFVNELSNLLTNCPTPPFNQMDSFGSLHSTSSSFGVTQGTKKQYASKAMQHNRRKCKKPNGKPKRPLSAYNLFFKSEREKLIRANRRLSFSNMAKEISVKWKAVDTEGRQVFVAAAEIEQISYRSAVSKWKAQIEHQLQMNHTSQPSQFGGATPLASLLAQTDPQLLQQVMMQQRMMQQQQQHQHHYQLQHQQQQQLQQQQRQQQQQQQQQLQQQLQHQQRR